MTVAIDTKALPFGNPGALTSYLHTRSIIELRALAQKLGIYQTTMRRRVVLIEAIVNAKAPKALPVIPAEGKYIAYDSQTKDYVMYLDGQLVGCARTQIEAETTLDTLVDEIIRHTRATTADMAAEESEIERAESRVAEHMILAENSDPVIKNLCATHASKTTWYARSSGAVDAPCDECCPAAPPTWTDDKIATGLAPDASDDDRSLALALSNLRARAQDEPTPPTRTVTIPSCDQHAGFSFNVVTLTLQWACPTCDGPRGEPYLTRSYDGSCCLQGIHGWQNPCGHVDYYGDVREEARRMVQAQPACPCGSSCPCCDPSHPDAIEQRLEREEAEKSDPDLDGAPSPDRSALAADLDRAVTARLPIPRNTPEWHAAQAVVQAAADALTFWPEHAPHVPVEETPYAGLGNDPPVTLPSDCWGYAEACQVPATQVVVIVDRGTVEVALCDGCATKWRRLHVVLPHVCGNCGGPHHVQRCPEIRAALVAPLWGAPNSVCPKCQQAHDPIVDCPGRREAAELREAQEELEYQGKALQAALDQVERMEDAISRVLLARNDMHPDRFVSYFDEVLTPILQGALDEEDEQNHRRDGPFASLRDMVYTECPCGCGNKEVCEEQRARVKAHDEKVPF